MKRSDILLVIFALFFLLETVYRAYEMLTGHLRAGVVEIVVLTYFLISSIGLYLKKAWGRNFALFCNSLIFLSGLRQIIAYFYLGSARDLPKGLLNIVISILIYFFLLKSNYESMLKKSPYSKIIIGASIALYCITARTGNSFIDYALLAIALFGFGIILKGSREIKELQKSSSK